MARKLPPPQDPILEERYRELERFQMGAGEIHRSVQKLRELPTNRPQPILEGLGKRKLLPVPVPREAEGLCIRVPDSVKTLQQVDKVIQDARTVIKPAGAAAKIQDTSDYISTYKGYTGIMTLEYNLSEPFVVHDTEAFVRQATKRKLSLMFRNGFEVTGTNQRNVDYINRCLEAMEYVMTNGGTLTTIKGFFTNILFSLLLCSNAFLLKIRDTDASAGVEKPVDPKKKKGPTIKPIAAYVFIPAHTILPKLEKGKIVKWRRFFDTGQPFEDLAVEDVLHLKWDCKPGHIAGTPRLVSVREDIYALRRLEENIELLFINHLFPLFHVKVGTESSPATFKDGVSEVDIVKYHIENMPKEGIFVTDERVEVETVGAEGSSLDPKDILAHYTTRVFTGLGVSPIDMGVADTANHSTADNISQVLKDSIKADWEIFAGLVRMGMFREWFMSAPHSMSVLKATAGTHLQAHEIDLDNKLKEENGIIQLYLNNLIDLDTAAKKLKLSVPDEKRTHYFMHIRDLAILTAKMKAAATGVTKKASPGAGTSGVKARPTNQHKTNPGPTKAKSSLLPEMRRALLDELELIRAAGSVSAAEWRTRSGKICDGFRDHLSAEPYTSQVRKGINRLDLEILKDQVAQTQDPELLVLLLENALDPDLEPDPEDPREPEDDDDERLESDPTDEDGDEPEQSGPDPAGTGNREPGPAAIEL
jgi:hypothetical protein